MWTIVEMDESLLSGETKGDPEAVRLLAQDIIDRYGNEEYFDPEFFNKIDYEPCPPGESLTQTLELSYADLNDKGAERYLKIFGCSPSPLRTPIASISVEKQAYEFTLLTHMVTRMHDTLPKRVFLQVYATVMNQQRVFDVEEIIWSEGREPSAAD